MNCALCANLLPFHPILAHEHRFCCHGCQAVFSILAAKNHIGEYRTSPVFIQAVRSGLISNPSLLEDLRAKELSNPSTDLQKFYFEIAEMWCPSCAEVIALVCMQEKGVCSCIVDYATDLAVVTFDPKRISKDAIFARIQALGYQPCRFEERHAKGSSSKLFLRFIVAAFFSLNAMMFSYPLYATYFTDDPGGYGLLFAWFSFAAAIPVMTYSAYPIFQRCWSAFTVGLFGMEALVVLGSSTAFIFSISELLHGRKEVYFDSTSVIITFVLLGKIIESKGKFSARESLFRLSRSIPKRVRSLRDGIYTYLPAKEVEVGSIIEVRMGESIAADGVVVAGAGICNEAVMTGEAIPLPKKPGDKVVSGSQMQQGAISISVSAKCDDSLLQRIIDMIEKDIGNKSSYIRRADLIVQWFVPTILLVAAAVAVGALAWGLGPEVALFRAMTVILISCPCAIGIAAPLAESHLIHRCASLGVIVRNRGCLRYLGRETQIVFDKTGTVTEGCFQLLAGAGGLSAIEKSLICGLVHKSNHPIAHALACEIQASPAAFEKIEEISGKGLFGIYEGQLYLLGSAIYLQEQGCEIEEISKTQEKVVTTVYFARKGQKALPLELGDRLRPSAAALIASLAPTKTLLLSGDGRTCVAAVAEKCGFSSFFAEMSPLDKHLCIQQFKEQGEIVCMVGDGINDAPALTAAHVAISVSAATEISIQVSDLLLTTDRLEVIAELRHLSRKGQRIIRQNLFWAFFYNVIGIGLAAFGCLSPLFAAFAMVASSLIVLFNAKRL